MDTKMTAALKTAKGDFSIAEVPVPELQKPDWVLARVKVAGFAEPIFAIGKNMIRILNAKVWDMN